MKTIHLETVVVSKDSWKFFKNYIRTERGFGELTDDSLESIWSKIQFRNDGANPELFPISENEIRIDRYSFGISCEKVMKILEEKGFSYRTDGFVAEETNI